jgi:hypothetical protein
MGTPLGGCDGGAPKTGAARTVEGAGTTTLGAALEEPLADGLLADGPLAEAIDDALTGAAAGSLPAVGGPPPIADGALADGGLAVGGLGYTPSVRSSPGSSARAIGSVLVLPMISAGLR